MTVSASSSPVVARDLDLALRLTELGGQPQPARPAWSDRFFQIPGALAIEIGSEIVHASDLRLLPSNRIRFWMLGADGPERRQLSSFAPEDQINMLFLMEDILSLNTLGASGHRALLDHREAWSEERACAFWMKGLSLYHVLPLAPRLKASQEALRHTISDLYVDLPETAHATLSWHRSVQADLDYLPRLLECQAAAIPGTIGRVHLRSSALPAHLARLFSSCEVIA